MLLCTASSGSKTELVAVPHETIQSFRWQCARLKYNIFKTSIDTTFQIL